MKLGTTSYKNLITSLYFQNFKIVNVYNKFGYIIYLLIFEKTNNVICDIIFTFP